MIPEGSVRPTAATDDPPASQGARYAGYQMFVAPKLDIEVQEDITSQVDREIVDARLRVANFDPAHVRSTDAEAPG